jgi:ABC-type polysaccharide/polyol phosphate transport system, ATPase component
MTSDVIVNVENVSMRFLQASEKITTFKEYVIKRIKRKITYTEFWALSDVSFQVRSGEIFGVLGLNGAGKSTLLKILSGVLVPTTGNVEIHGNIAPLIELGAGFDPELTARENIFLNGATLGFGRKEMNAKFDEIVAFSELEEFLDVPIKNFSSGMYARLGFSIAISVNPEILIIDEVLSVGDFMFQQKCENKIKDMIDNGATVILVSHSIEQVRSLCSKGIVLERGRVVKSGNIDELCDFYYERYR